MTILKKLLLIALVASLAIGIGLFLVTKFLPESDFIKQTIETKLTEATGCDVSLGMVRVEVGFPSLINFTVENVAIRDETRRDLLSVGSVRLNIEFWSLITSKPSIDNLKIFSAKIQMYRDSAGNIDSVFSKKPEIRKEIEAPSTLTESSETIGKVPAPSRGIGEKTDKVSEERKFSWPIRYIEIKSSEIVLEDSSIGQNKPLRFAFSNINGEINRKENTFDFSVVGTPVFPGLQSAELVTKGSLQLDPDFSSIQNALMNCKLESAKLSDLTFLPPHIASWFSILEANKIDLTAKIEQGQPPRIAFSAGMFSKGDQSSALKLSASGILTPDFKQIEEGKLNGVSEDIPVKNLSGTLPKEILVQLGAGGSIKTSFEGSWTRLSGWSVTGSAKLSDLNVPSKFSFLGRGLRTTCSFKITSDSLAITDFQLQNENSDKLISLKGNLNDPFSENRSLDINARADLKSEWISRLGISLPKNVVQRGPIPVSANLHTNISSSRGILNLRNLSFKIVLPENKHALLSTKGHINSLNSDKPELGLEGNLVVNREVIDLLGLTSKTPLDLEGAANFSYKITGSPKSFKWSLNAPFKDVRISIGSWFVKKSGVDLEIASSGTRTPEEIHIDQTRIKTTGMLALASGSIGNQSGKPTSINLEIKEAEMSVLLGLFPSLGQSGFSGPFRGNLTVNSAVNGFPIKGLIQLISVNFKPHKSPLSFENINGTLEISEASIESKQIKGFVHGTVEAPVKASIKLSGLEKLGSINGKINVAAGPGKLSADRLRSVLEKTRLLLEPFLNQGKETKKFNPFELESLTADLQIDSGVIRTENLKLRAPELFMGAIGSANMTSQQIDILSYIKTSSAPLAAIGSIPMVKDIIKKNEGLLKITGLDKELKKLGIEAPEKPQADQSEQPKKEGAVNIMVKISGPWAEPAILPVLENALPKNQLNQLKDLVH